MPLFGLRPLEALEHRLGHGQHGAWFEPAGRVGERHQAPVGGNGEEIEQTARRIRHLAVLRNDRVVGVLSIGDLVKALLDEQPEIVRRYLGV